MPIYRMAGLNVRIEPQYEKLRQYAEKYLCTEPVSGEVIDLFLPEDFIEKKKQESPYLVLEDIEYIYIGAIFARKLIKRGGFMLHSSAIEYENKAYLFSAASGTGKSTHTGFWQKVFGKDKTTMINDDKPAIREIDGIYCACGSAFSGKTPTSANVQVPIRAVCFIHRSEKDEIRQLEPAEALPLIFEQTLWKGSEEYMALFLARLDDFLKNVPCYSVGVTLSENSARFVYNALN